MLLISTDHTALDIKTPSPGIVWLQDHHFFKSEDVQYILDYGAGYGRNAKYLRDLGYDVYAYDPAHNNKDGPWYGVDNVKPPEHLYFDLAITSYLLNVVYKDEQFRILDYINKFADQAIHIVRYKDLITQLNGTKTKYESYWEKKGISDLSLEEKAKHGFSTSKGYQRLVDLDNYKTKEYHVNLIKDAGNYRIYHQITNR